MSNKPAPAVIETPVVGPHSVAIRNGKKGPGMNVGYFLTREDAEMAAAEIAPTLESGHVTVVKPIEERKIVSYADWKIATEAERNTAETRKQALAMLSPAQKLALGIKD